MVSVKAAIYARYSSDLQSEASIEDQVRVCREMAMARGWEVIEVYADRPAGLEPAALRQGPKHG